MAICKRGRSSIVVGERGFVWWVYAEREVRITSEEKRFAISYHWCDEPLLAVTGREFPGIEPSETRPVWLIPPLLKYRSPAGLAKQLIEWAFSPGRESVRRVQS